MIELLDSGNEWFNCDSLAVAVGESFLFGFTTEEFLPKIKAMQLPQLIN